MKRPGILTAAALSVLTHCASPTPHVKPEAVQRERARITGCLECADPDYLPPAPATAAATVPVPAESVLELAQTVPSRLTLWEGIKAEWADILASVDGFKWVGKLPGNGGRDVLVFIPAGSDPGKPFELIFHFHGVNGDDLTKSGTGRNRLAQVLEAAKRMQREQGRNIVVVYPISAGHRAKAGKLPRLRYDAAWMLRRNSTGDDMARLHEEALGILASELGSRPRVASVTASGHSAGGAPLVHIALGGFPVDEYNFLDAAYGDRARRCYREAIQVNPRVQVRVFFIPNTQTDNSFNASLRGQPGVTLTPVTGVPHGQMNERFFGWKPD